MKGKKFLHRILIVLIVVLCFIPLLSIEPLSYQGKYGVKNRQISYLTTNENFNYILNETGFLLYHQLVEGQGKDYLSLYLINKDTTDTTTSSYAEYENVLKETLELTASLGNIQGSITDNTTAQTRRFANSSTLPQCKPNEEINPYLLWIEIDYDAMGNQTINSNLQGVFWNFDPLLAVFQETGLMKVESNPEVDLQVPELKNIRFTLGIPENYSTSDYLGNILNNMSFWAYHDASRQMISATLTIMLFISLFLVSKKSRESQFGSWLSKMPLEIRVIVGFLVLFGSTELAYNYAYLISQPALYDFGEILLYHIFFGCELLGIYATVFWVRCLFIDKVKGTLNHLATVEMWKKIYHKGWDCYNLVRQWMHECFTVNFSDKSHSRLIRIMIVNVLLIFILCLFLTPFFGSIIYTVILYVIIMRSMKHLKHDYEVLLGCTRRMAEGDLESAVIEQLGVFEPLKEELDDIRYGFKIAIEQETKSQKMKTELISNVSHDLKTPLTSLISFIDLLKSETNEEKRLEYITVLERNSMRLKHLIEDLFEVSKANSGAIKLDIMDVDLISLVSQTLFELAPQIEKANLQMKTSYGKEKIVLPLDSQKTYRIVENLVSNAVKYSLPGSRVYLTIVDTSDEVILSIRNISMTEIDFDPNDIMERFVRGDKSRNSEGSGLGLAIAKGFAEAQKANFKIETDGDSFKVIVTFKKGLEPQLIQLKTQ